MAKSSGFALSGLARRTPLAGFALTLCLGVAGACGGGGNSGSNFVPGHGDASVDAYAGSDAPDDSPSLFRDASLDGPSASVSSLAFNPPSATISLTGTGSGSATYTLTATYADGHSAEVQAQSIAFDRPDLATLTPGDPVKLTAAGPYAGVGHVQAIYGGKSASAELTVQIAITVVGKGVPPGAVKTLGGKGLSQDPEVSSLLYPYDKTVFALGLTSPLVMWNAPNPADVYRLHYAEKNYTYDGYFLVAPPAQISADQTNWDTLTASNGGDPLVATLDRWDATTEKAYTSATESWTIAPSSLQGAIYYWAIAQAGGAATGASLSRIYPGTGSAPEVLSPGTDAGSGGCMGCHAVSADGSTLVAAVENEGSTDNGDARAWVSYDLPNVTVRDEPHLFGGNVGVTPDGKYTVFDTAPLELASTTSGVEIASALQSYPLGTGYATLAHPVFAPDGKHFAAIESNSVWYQWTLGQLVLFDWDETGTAFSSPQLLANGATFPDIGTATAQAVAYPTFSPDSNWLAFHVADYASGCHDACNVPTTDVGAIWLQNVKGSAPVRLTTLTDSSPNLADHDVSFEPTFNPVERGGYFWVVFTSMRQWGNAVTGTPDCGQKRLWVAAIDPSGGLDPSHPPFFLQGQGLDTMNMRGFWSLAACIPTKGGGSCQQDYQCCSGFCDMGKCVDTGTVSCMGAGGTCKMPSDCCNSEVVNCVSGTCTPAMSQ